MICLSASHKNSHFDVLEKLSLASAAAAQQITACHSALSGAIVVATCNRFEAYLDLDEPFGVSPMPAIHAAIDALSATSDVAAETLRDTLQLVHGNGVPHHLFAVSSGLESVVVGEGEIAGQVRRSLEQARSDGTTSPELERLFQRASQTSRGVKNQTGLGTAGRSLVRLSLELASSRVSDWAASRVLLLGTGRYAGATLAALRDRGAENVRVYSPSGRAVKFAESHGIAAVVEADLAREAARADLIITCTTADHFVVDAALLGTGRHALGQDAAAADAQPLKLCPIAPSPAPAETTFHQLIIDLGMPRNVDPDVTQLAGVALLDLETIRIHAPLEALNATSEARELVSQAARDFTAVSTEQSLAPAVVALRSHVFDILEAEIERVRSRNEHSAQTEAALRHLVGVLLHTPMLRSRELARSGEHDAYFDGLEALFGLKVERADASGPSARTP
nr:glutamyl-tRNA reductase [Leifsonia psychrotolerans]